MSNYEYIKGGQDLGVERDDVDFAFKFFGEEIRVHPEAGEMSFAEFMEKAAKIDEEDIKNSMLLTMEFLRNQIHPDDWERFSSLAKKKRQGIEDLLKVSNYILETLSGFPTGQPSSSSTGQSRTERRSKAVSSSRATPRRKSRQPRQVETERALKLLPGRPDLQMAVVRAGEARLAS